MSCQRLRFAVVGFWCVLVGLVSAAPALEVSNFADGQTIRYPVPLLLGTLSKSAEGISVVNRTHPRAEAIAGQVHAGRFKALAELVPGTNRLELTAGSETLAFTLNYQPQTNPHVIRAVYFVDNTGDTRYDTPLADDAQDFRGKFDTVLKLMQSFTAEWMNHYGYGRRTFNLELDEQGQVIVHVVKGRRPADWYRYDVGDRGHLYNTISQETAQALPKAPSIDCVLIAFSKLDPKTGKSVAYTALGGGKVALFGGACMYSFPDRVADIQKAFLDPTVIDKTKYVSDSVNRFTMWGTASTSIGAIMHENGHSMGLPHTLDWRDMMTRGMDHIGRNFVFYDPPSLQAKDAVYFRDNQIGYWSPESAAALAPSVWLNMDATQVEEVPDQTAITYAPRSQEIIITSPLGIGFLGYEVPGQARDFVRIDQANLPRELRLPLRTVREALKDKPAQVRVIDGKGNMSTMRIAELTNEFVRTWHLGGRAGHWEKGDAPELSAADLATLTADLARQPLTTSARARINLARQYPDARTPRAAYALRIIRSEEARTVRLLTGSDDGLRIWLNGRLVVSALKPRAARADAETTEVQLNPGDNPLLVEVTDHGSAWALYLRLTDPSGHPLRLEEDGTLTPVDPAPIAPR